MGDFSFKRRDVFVSESLGRYGIEAAINALLVAERNVQIYAGHPGLLQVYLGCSKLAFAGICLNGVGAL